MIIAGAAILLYSSGSEKPREEQESADGDEEPRPNPKVEHTDSTDRDDDDHDDDDYDDDSAQCTYLQYTLGANDKPVMRA
jgi:hypothetical protein